MSFIPRQRSRLLRDWGSARRAVAAVALFTLPAHAASVDDGERHRIAEERAAIESRYAARERECRTRFVVTSCVDDARRDRRRGLDDLRARQLQVDEARRRERAAERQAELAAKAAEDARREQERAARVASPPPRREPRPLEPRRETPPAGTAASPGAAHDRPSAKRERSGLKPAARAESAEGRREREAAHRASYEARQRAAAEHRQQTLDKAAQRLKNRPAAASLPVPASVPAR